MRIYGGFRRGAQSESCERESNQSEWKIQRDIMRDFITSGEKDCLMDTVQSYAKECFIVNKQTRKEDVWGDKGMWLVKAGVCSRT